ncbi:hypothetical protein [Chondrinema litorale]|uniref:hypothetical protein n=1 Tax=Chondrinema litorale TaxID=2994555 RepID=UPI0025427F11|nr:hypothetical protein [Chondrinema litorale]UZR95972.1 hypothetical protein OQ292_09120 [Chondrinema litorale]UZR96289.1 hypothetical protein OQ292_21740 [Chondrinema litorale]
MENRMTSIDANLLASPSEQDERIRILQRKLYIRAKQEPEFKAYSLYGKLCEGMTLVTAYYRVKSNYSEGVGVDGESFETIEERGLKSFLEEIQYSLISKGYRSQAVRQVLIPKEKKGGVS